MRTQRMQRAVLAWLAGGCLLLAGCAEPSRYGAVEFRTTPPGAEVVNVRDDANLGTTPVKVVWEGGEGKPEYVTVELRKQGYLEKITSFWVNKRYETREEALANPQPVFVELTPRNE